MKSMKPIWRLSLDETGSAMVELAFTMPLLLLILFGAVDMGRMFYTLVTVTGSAVAGAQFGVAVSSNNADFTGMQQAALNDVGNISGVTATATSYCECLDGTSLSCNGTCSGVAPPKYLKVSTTATFATLFSYPLLPSTVPLSGVSVQRVQ